MNTSSKRSAVAAALILSAGALAGCGGDDAGEAADATATPAWETTPRAAPPSTNGPADETPAATEPAAAAEEPQAAPDAPDEEPAGQPADDGGGGDAADAPADDESGDESGGQQPQPDPGGTDDDPAPVAQPIDGCALGADAIAGVLGAGPTPEDLSDPEGFGPGCFWTGAGGDELVLSVSTFDDWIGAADVPGGGTETVDGLGTEAWASLSAPSNLQLAWRRDDVSVSVSASLASGGPQLVDVARAIDAALQAAGY